MTKQLIYLTVIIALFGGACRKKDNNGKTPLAITSFLPTSGLAGTLVTIYGRGLGADTLTNAVTFNGARASIFQVTDSSLVVLAPSGGTTGPVVVAVGEEQASAGTYTYQTLSLHSATPLNGPAGTNVTITGSGFVGKSGLPTVTFNGRAATVTSAGDTTLVAAVPDSAGVGPIAIQVNGQSATGPVFTYQHISTITPLTGGTGTTVTIHGVGFGTDPTKVSVDFNGTLAQVVSVTADSLIVVNAPGSVKTGPVEVTINNEKTVGTVFTVVPFPTISTITPSSGLVGAQVVIAGANYSIVPAENKVSFNGTAATVTASTTTQLNLTIPVGATTGPLTISVNQQQITGPVFKVQALNITAITPNNGLAGGTVAISGNGFDATMLTNNKVFFNGLAAVVTAAKDTQLIVTVPTGVTTGPISAQVGPLTAQGPVFSRAGVTTIYSTVSASPVNGIAADPNGNIYFTQTGNSSIQKIGSDGTVSVYAGSPTQTGGSATDGPIAGARFSNNLAQMRCDAQGNLYLADNGNACIREITASGTVKTLIMSLSGGEGFSIYGGQMYFGLSYGSGGLYVYNPALGTYSYAWAGAQNEICSGVALDAQGNIYYAGQYNGGAVDIFSPTGTLLQYITGFNDVTSVAQDPTTGMVIAQDQGALSLTQLDPNTGAKTVLFQMIQPGAGTTPIDGTLSQAKFNTMNYITIDYQGAIYVVDGYNTDPGYSAIRKIVTH